MTSPEMYCQGDAGPLQEKGATERQMQFVEKSDIHVGPEEGMA